MIGFNLKHRLVSFGCSLTYGYGLPGCYNIRTTKQGMFPSKLAWPHLLAKLLDKKSTNLSESGCSNKHIWNRIVNFKFKKNDTVIILWTYRYRNTVLKNKNDGHHIKPYNVEKDIISKNYYETNKLSNLFNLKFIILFLNLFNLNQDAMSINFTYDMS